MSAGKAKVSQHKAGTKAVKKHPVTDKQKLTRLVEDIIEQGADTAEDINRAVLELPVTVLESLGLKETAEEIKKIQDASLGAIYKLIHDINHEVADLATDLLKQRKAKKK